MGAAGHCEAMRVKWISQSELERITETAIPAEQVTVLRRFGIVPLVGSRGAVRVTPEAIQAAMMGQKKAEADLDWSAYHAAKERSRRRLAS